jgi:hypothetical protein
MRHFALPPPPPRCLFVMAVALHAVFSRLRRYMLRQCADACGGCGFVKCNLGGKSEATYVLEPNVTAAWTDLPAAGAPGAASSSFSSLPFGSSASSPPRPSGAVGATASADTARFFFNYSFGSPVRGAAPEVATLVLTVNASMAGAVDIDYELTWWGKAPTREAEALWFTISPIVNDDQYVLSLCSLASELVDRSCG